MTAPKLAFDDPNGKGRYYFHPGRQGATVPSVTNIIGKLDKPGLKYWGAKMVAGYCADNRELLATLDRDQAFAIARNSPFVTQPDSPAVIGDIVHEWVERWIKGTPPAAEEVSEGHRTAQAMWTFWQRFVSDNPELKFTGSEFTVWSDTHGYAGSADLSFELNGWHVLADIKTGERVYPEAGLQLAALSNADVMVDETGREVALPKYDRCAVLHLRPKSWALYPIDNGEEAFKAFLALKAIFDWHVTYAPETIRFVPKHN